jgi:uncharacterized protein (DUF2147 family)
MSADNVDRRLVAMVLLLALLGAGRAQASADKSPEGRWLTDDGKAVVAIERCGDALCGHIDSILDTGAHPTTDLHNADDRLRRRPLVGLTILSGLRQANDGWTGGRAYDPKSGRTFRASLKVPGARTLALTGCVLFVCRTQRWSRVP